MKEVYMINSAGIEFGFRFRKSFTGKMILQRFINDEWRDANKETASALLGYLDKK